MKSTLNKTNDVNGTIVIELGKEDYQENFNKSLNQYRQIVNIPGFRKGKVPKGIIKKLYGKSILTEEVNKLVTEELSNFISENKLKILGNPLPDEGEDKQVDFEKDEIMKFYFDVALTPEFELSLDKKTELTLYNVKLEDELLDKQMDGYRQQYGTYESVAEEVKDTDLIKGVLLEMEGDDVKENGKVVENAILMPSYVKDDTIKKEFVGAKIGDSVVFNPLKAYDNNKAEVASLLQTAKDEIEEDLSDYKFEIRDVTRYKEAELNQELFDKVLGEGIVTTEKDFREKIAAELANQFKPSINHLFIHQARDLILEQMKDVVFPDDFLKRWLLKVDEKRTEEELEKDYPKIQDDLKFSIAKQKILEENKLKVEADDVKELATEVAKAQFAQYGMSNLPVDVLENYTNSLLEKEETVNSLFERASENKVIDWLKDNVTVEEKEILSKDFNNLLTAHAQSHNDNKEQEAQEDASPDDNKEE